jgi:hypothetical protein
MKLFCSIFIGIGLVFMAVGVGLGWSQHRAIRRATPVDAVVLETRIETHRSTGSHGHTRSTTYSPVVRYRYAVGGVAHEANRVLPLDISSGHAWASGIVSRFPLGHTVQAWYDPASPGDAFLLRDGRGHDGAALSTGW